MIFHEWTEAELRMLRAGIEVAFKRQQHNSEMDWLMQGLEIMEWVSEGVEGPFANN